MYVFVSGRVRLQVFLCEPKIHFCYGCVPYTDNKDWLVDLINE